MLRILASNSSILLMKLFKRLIRSKLDYGSIVYGSARKSYLQMPETIHHQGHEWPFVLFGHLPKRS